MVGISVANRQTLDNLQRRAHNIICGFDCPCNIFEDLTNRRNRAAVKFLHQVSLIKEHPLHYLCPLRSSRTGKFLVPYCKTTRRRNSFFPATVILLNKTHIDWLVCSYLVVCLSVLLCLFCVLARVRVRCHVAFIIWYFLAWCKRQNDFHSLRNIYISSSSSSSSSWSAFWFKCSRMAPL